MPWHICKVITRLVTLKRGSRRRAHMCAFFIYESMLVYFRYVVGMLVNCRFEFGIVGLMSAMIPVLLWLSVLSESHVGYLSVSDRLIPSWIVPQMTPTWGRLFLLCLLQHCRWPTAVRSNDKLCILSVSCRFGRCNWGITLSLRGLYALGATLWI